MAVSTPRRRSTKPLIVTLIVIVAIAALGFAYASPYIALNNLKRAADTRDAQTVNEYVDFPALRDSLKQQVTTLLTNRIEGHGGGNPFAAIGAMIGVALIGPLVDAYATPDGVAALLNGMPPHGKPGERPPVPPAAQNAPAPQPAPAPGPAPAPAQGNAPANSSANGAAPQVATPSASPQPPQTTAGYTGINEFVVTYQHGAGDARYSAIFRREGLFTWKLAAVNLNE